MKYSELVRTGEKVSAIGLGCMGMSEVLIEQSDNQSFGERGHNPYQAL